MGDNIDTFISSGQFATVLVKNSETKGSELMETAIIFEASTSDDFFTFVVTSTPTLAPQVNDNSSSISLSTETEMELVIVSVIFLIIVSIMICLYCYCCKAKSISLDDTMSPFPTSFYYENNSNVEHKEDIESPPK